MDNLKRGEVPSCLNPLLDEMRSVAKQEGIPEPYNIELVGWDDGTYRIRLVHYWDDYSKDVIDVSEDGVEINKDNECFSYETNSDSIGAAVRYVWNEREIVVEREIYDRNESGNQREVIKKYDPPVEVIEAFRSRDGLWVMPDLYKD